ncbi:MAG: HAMP domain-containing histidine kinase [Saprospiraceae bacterium]|nr:HAMP domain-containing histidine kinase [Saprospiraceae bacterium]
MKLLVSSNRRFLPFLIIILVLSGGLFYWVVQYIVREEADEKLFINEQRIIKFLKEGKVPVSMRPMLEINELEKMTGDTSFFSDTTIFDPLEKEFDVFRQRCTQVAVNGIHYEVINRSPIIDARELIATISALTAFLLLFLLGISYWLNHRAAKSLWRPFYQVLSQLRSFNANQEQSIQLPVTDIDEFQDLNQELFSLMDKVRLEYRNLKEFTGNVSHELQTPLSLMRAKLEQLINDPSKNREAIVLELYDDTSRMSKLINELLFFARIEGQQYKRNATVRLDEEIQTALAKIREMEIETNFNWTIQLVPVTLDQVNTTLLDVLLKNLFENAMRYTRTNGNIRVELSNDYFILKNQGSNPLNRPEKIFDRFYRDPRETGHSYGLGLAISRKIAEHHGWRLTYAFLDGYHIFKIHF